MKHTITTLCAALTLLGSVHAQDRNQASKSHDPEFLRKAAYEVDVRIARIFKQKKLSVPQVVDDPTFLRRAFLVAAGRIPTLDEAKMFLEIDDPNKRQLLIDYLLKSDGYRSHMANWAYDLLRAQDDFPGQGGSAQPYMQFITESIAQNKPWDDFVRELISAEGNGWSKGNGAVGYFVRDKAMELDNLATTMRIFTGERMECAQCHDSPTNKWERIDFFELAAFTNGQSEINRGPWEQVYRRESQRETERRSPYEGFLRWLEYNVHYMTLSGGGKGRIALPKDYQYRDADPGEIVGGKTHFGPRIRSSDRRDSGESRKEFAEWMTSPENDNFTYTIVNRMWDRVMGSPLSGPVDAYVKPEDTISPDLVNYLNRLMISLDYDLKAFQHVLFLTKTFQFAANPEAFDAGLPQSINGRQLERMTAEQIWDSFVTLVTGDPDNLPKRQFSDVIVYNGKPVMVGKLTMSELSEKILSIKSADEYESYTRDLLEQFKTGGGGDSMSMMEAGGRPGPASGLARASELPAPAPAGHFLREFGQSDRDLVDSATIEPNMAQVLTMMNGHVEKMVVSNSDAAVYKALEQGSTDADKVRYLFYAILGRPPGEREMTLLMRDVIDGSKENYRNLVSALVMTREFLFIQ
ncbi:MAG: DUF1549 domain-containing protein [Verrucomicrobiales bacterium]